MPQTYLDHVAPSIELAVQMWASDTNNFQRCVMQFGTSVYNTVMWWREFGEVKNEGTLHNFSLFAIILPKIIKISGIFTKLWKKTMLHSFSPRDTVL